MNERKRHLGPLFPNFTTFLSLAFLPSRISTLPQFSNPFTFVSRIQGLAKRWSLGLVNFVTALVYHLCLAMPTAFTQPRNHLLAEPCKERERERCLLAALCLCRPPLSSHHQSAQIMMEPAEIRQVGGQAYPHPHAQKITIISLCIAFYHLL